MEKIDGNPRLKIPWLNPSLLFKNIKTLGELHFQIINIKAPDDFIGLKEKIRNIFEKIDFMDPCKMDFAYEILGQLPDNDNVNHGDFHPGNILYHDDTPYVIDWGFVTKADQLADLANTYVKFKKIPRDP